MSRYSKGHSKVLIPKLKKPQFISGNEHSIFQTKEIINKQRNLADIYEKCSKEGTVKESDKIKFQQIIYQKGDFVEVYSLNQTQNYICRLTKIISVPKEKEMLPFIETQWTLRKKDLPQDLIKEYGHYISEAEVFPSNLKCYLYVQSLKCKSTILTIHEYGQLYICNDAINFSRSNYDYYAKKLTPDPSEWQSDCHCGGPTNPDLVYVQCSKCDKWFHLECVKAKVVNGNFLCDSCFGVHDSPIKKKEYQDEQY